VVNITSKPQAGIFGSAIVKLEGNRSSFRNVVFFGIQDDGKRTENFCEFCATYIIARILSSLPINEQFLDQSSRHPEKFSE
jgi:hypothetical protein